MEQLVNLLQHVSTDLYMLYNNRKVITAYVEFVVNLIG